MTLYHFCPAFLLDAIRAEGLTMGAFPVYKGGHYSMLMGCQWLTKDSDPKNQSWNTRNLISYSRTEYRLTIEIPESRKKKLHRATDFALNFPPEAQGIVFDWPGHENWYIFCGKIPPAWIIGCRKMVVADGA